jgi:hypothetical protein
MTYDKDQLRRRLVSMGADHMDAFWKDPAVEDLVMLLVEEENADLFDALVICEDDDEERIADQLADLESSTARDLTIDICAEMTRGSK